MPAISECQIRDSILAIPENLREVLPGFLFAARNGKSTYCDSRVAELMGFTAEEFAENPRLWWERLHPDDVEHAKESLGGDQAFCRIDYRFLHRDGRYRWVRNEISRIARPDGSLSAEIVGFAYDITQQKTAEATLRLTQGMVEQSSTGILRSSDTGRILYANARLRELLQYSAEEIGHLHLWDIDPDIQQSTWSTAWRDLSRRKNAVRRTTLVSKSRQRIRVEVHASHYHTDNSEFSINFITEIGEREKVESERTQLAKILHSVSKIGQIALRAETESDLYRDVCRCLRDDAGYDSATVEYTDSTFESIAPAESGTVRFHMRMADNFYGTLSIKPKSGARLLPNEETLLAQVSDDLALAVKALRDRKKLEQSERRFRVLFESASIGLYIHDVSTMRLLAVNIKGLKDLGCSSLEEVQNRGFVGDPPYSVSEMRAWVLKAAKEGPQRFEWRIQKDGQYLWHDTALHFVILDGIPCVLAMSIDITDRMRIKNQLRRLNAELERRVDDRTQEVHLQAGAMDSVLEGMAILRNETFIYMNPAHAAMYGYSAAELIGKTWRELYAPEQVKRFEANVFPILHRQKKWLGEVVGRRKDGTPIDVEVGLTSISDTDFACVCREISKRKILEEQDRRAREELMAANKLLLEAVEMRSDFLANVSHELRTPLTGILGMTEVLRDSLSSWNHKQEEALSVIETSGEHLLRVIDNILDITKTRAGVLKLEREQVSANLLCVSSIALVKSLADEKRQRLELRSLSPDVMLFVDPVRIRQALVNLLANAIKFTASQGVIVLEFRWNDDAGEVQFVVSDTGIGIAADDLGRIFMPFTRLETGLTRNHSGVGLGLPLAKQIIEKHGGQLTVSSRLGRGSEFCIHLPIGEPFEEETTPYAPLIDRC